MLTLKIENENIEQIFLNEFHSNKEMFFEFIQNSFEKMKSKNDEKLMEENFIKAQEGSMAKTWNDENDFNDIVCFQITSKKHFID